MKRVNSFTLIELLIVILIIALLVSLILPALMRSRDKTYDTQCQNNLKNLHQAAMNHLYDRSCLPASRGYEWKDTAGPIYWLEEYGWCGWRDWRMHGTAPTGGNSVPGRPDVWWGRWGQFSITNVHVYKQSERGDYQLRGLSLWLFAGQNMKIYMCPRFSQRIKGATAPDGTVLGPNNPAYRSYVMNHSVGKDFGRDSAGLTLGSLMNASRKLLFADAHDHNTNRAINRAGTAQVRICRQGIRENLNPTFASSGAFPAGQYILDATYEGGIRPCSYDGSLYGLPDATAVPVRSWPIETVGVYHGTKKVNGVDHPYGYGIFIDGHVESLFWWQTTNACSGNW